MVDDERTMDRRRLDGYPISSPCEPNASGELNSYLISHSDPVRNPIEAFICDRAHIKIT